ncbi:hypothetical protein ACTFIY_003041 [Dictyostelium cf. discoideum]
MNSNPCKSGNVICIEDYYTKYELIFILHLKSKPNSYYEINQELYNLPNLTGIDLANKIVFTIPFYESMYKFEKLDIITKLNLNSGPGPYSIIKQDLSELPNLTEINLAKKISFDYYFYESMYKLEKLNTLSLQTFVNAVPETFVFPPIWFESTIEVIRVYSTSNGFSLPKEFTKIIYIFRELGLPITYYSNIPLNLNQMYPNLEYLNLEIYNDMDQPGYKDISISSTGIFQKLNYIKMYFYHKSNPQGISFSQLLLNTPMLERLTIQEKGFIHDPSIGFTDLSYINGLNPLHL